MEATPARGTRGAWARVRAGWAGTAGQPRRGCRGDGSSGDLNQGCFCNTWAPSLADAHPTRGGAWALPGDAASEEVGLEGHFLFPQQRRRKSDHTPADAPVLRAHARPPPRGPRGWGRGGLAWERRGPVPPLCARLPSWRGQEEAGPGLGTGLGRSQAPGPLGRAGSVAEGRRAQQPLGGPEPRLCPRCVLPAATQPLWASRSSCAEDGNSARRGRASRPAAEGSPAR